MSHQTLTINRDPATLGITVLGKPDADQVQALYDAYKPDLSNGWAMSFPNLTFEQLEALSPE